MFGSRAVCVYWCIVRDGSFLSLVSVVVISALTLLTIFGGRIGDIYTFLTEERPDDWELRICDQMGLTTTTFNCTVFGVRRGIKEEVNQPLNIES
jgi:hypothetical protein